MSTQLVASDGDDAVALTAQLRRAFDGGPAVGLGMLRDEPSDVPEGTAAVIATSGSTGIPKRVVLSAEALRASAEATAERVGHGAWLLALPASYVAGLQVLVRSLLAGTTPVVLPGRFTPQAFAASTFALTGPRGTSAEGLYTSLVPAQIATLVEAADDPAVLQALRAYSAILVGGQALPAPLAERAAELGARIVRTYGSSETSGGCIYDGEPLDTVAVRSVDGELRIAGPMLADGYLGDEAMTARVFVRDERGIRWYRTGDLGLVEDGIVRVHGRADNVIVSGGINVSLDRVERVVRGIAGLAGAVVVGAEDAQWGEASVIVAARGAALRRTEAEQLAQARAAVEAEIGRHARPARLILLDEIPVLTSGKPDREALRRIAAELR